MLEKDGDARVMVTAKERCYRDGISPGERSVLQSTKLKGAGALRSCDVRRGDDSVGSALLVSVCFGPVFSHCALLPPFCDGDAFPVSLHVGSIDLFFLIFTGDYA
ncbi:hypothetical protein ACRRTK_006282 [Alexandromys fortis]